MNNGIFGFPGFPQQQLSGIIKPLSVRLAKQPATSEDRAVVAIEALS
jgi:hypothetical protein